MPRVVVAIVCALAMLTKAPDHDQSQPVPLFDAHEVAQRVSYRDAFRRRSLKAC